MVDVTPEEFEELVADALDEVPPDLLDLLDNVVFLVEDEAPADRGPLTRMCEDREDLREEVVITVVHEIAHHFGIDEQALHDLGWG